MNTDIKSLICIANLQLIYFFIATETLINTEFFL